MSKFEETQLPEQKDFYNDLTEEACSDEDYNHVKRVWRTFKMKNLGDLCDLYVASDVLLLSAVFQKYREECLESYGLDSLWYFTCPGNY